MSEFENFIKGDVPRQKVKPTDEKSKVIKVGEHSLQVSKTHLYINDREISRNVFRALIEILYPTNITLPSEKGDHVTVSIKTVEIDTLLLTREELLTINQNI